MVRSAGRGGGGGEVVIFQATWRQVLAGTKTQTRRIVGSGQRLFLDAGAIADWDMECGKTPRSPGVFVETREITGPMAPWEGPEEVQYTYTQKWGIGHTYAVQPGRTQKAVGRIRITRIRQERVQDITEADVEAEGVGLQAWAGEGHEGWPRTAGYAQLWDSLHDRPGERWADNPAVWVLEFELVEKR